MFLYLLVFIYIDINLRPIQNYHDTSKNEDLASQFVYRQIKLTFFKKYLEMRQWDTLRFIAEGTIFPFFPGNILQSPRVGWIVTLGRGVVWFFSWTSYPSNKILSWLKKMNRYGFDSVFFVQWVEGKTNTHVKQQKQKNLCGTPSHNSYLIVTTP